MRLLHPVSIAVAIALGGATYIALQSQTSTPYERKAEFLEKKAQSKSQSPKRYDKPKEAQEFFVQQRLPVGTSSLPVEKYSQALKKIKEMTAFSISENAVVAQITPKLNAPDGNNQELGQWQELGPGNIGGRTRTLIIHPTDHDIMYTAGVAGGVWKTTDAGASWTPLSDLATNLAVTTLTFDPNNANTIYAGTGEGLFNFDALRGDGIFKSEDAGATWTQISSTSSNTDFHYVNKIVFSPNNANTLYVATRSGVLKSSDGGASWETKFVPQGSSAGCTDLKLISQSNTDILLTACGSFNTGGVHRSADAAENWTQVIAGTDQGRTTIAVAPSDNNIIYALAANRNDHGMDAVYKSTDMGVNWTTTVTRATADRFTSVLLSNPYFGLLDLCTGGTAQSFNQGWYDNIIAVDPVNPDVVWTGGIDTFRSDDGGQTFVPASIWWLNPTNPQYAHADHHEFVFHPDYDGVNNTTLYVANDGGIQRTDNALGGRLTIDEVCGNTNADSSQRVSWSTLNNGYAVTQFYHGTVKPSGTSYFGGTQDNGTLVGEDGEFNGWVEILGGDGGWTAIDPTNPNIMFAETTRLSLRKSTDGGQSFSSAVSGISGDSGFPFITRFEMAPSNPQVLWIGGNQLWRTTDQADSWSAASGSLDGSVYSIAIAPNTETAVAAGTDNGTVYVSYQADQATETSTWVSSTLAQGVTVSSIAFDPDNNQTIYATVSNFGATHVWKTTDGGQTWQASDSGLPDIPAMTIAIDPENPQKLFVGTDLGVFVSVDGGQNWMADGSGLANTNIAKLAIKGRELFAFTHGRSTYKVAMNADTMDRSFTTDEDTEVAVGSAFVDNLNSAFDSIEIIQLPNNGALKLGEQVIEQGAQIMAQDYANVVYMPSEDFSGEDSFIFEDMTANSQPVPANDTLPEGQYAVSISVNPVNDAPVIEPLEDVELYIGELTELDFNEKVEDVENDELMLQLEPSVPGMSFIDGVLAGRPFTEFDSLMTLTVSDGELQTQQEFNISISAAPDRGPVIETGQVFEVMENNESGASIGILIFSDPDPDISPVESFMILDEVPFTIEPTGELFVTTELDYEMQSEYSFFVRAMDSLGNYSEYTEVTVEVLDEVGDDDVEPVIKEEQHFEVMENSPIDTVIGMIEFEDPDADESPVDSFVILGDVPFEITPNGEIKVTGEIDFEVSQSFVFGVKAVDTMGNESDFVEVKVDVIDDPDDDQVPDRSPMIPSNQTFEARENTAFGTVIGRLEFSDPDSDISPVESFMVIGNAPFTIAGNGDIVVQGELDYEFQNVIRFGVRAQDSFGNVSEYTEITVNIIDVRGDDDDDQDGDSGSLGLLALLSLPLALLRRRRR
ncbi:rhombosortase-dependent cadherin domain-containing protein [Pseudoalteromonas umbrosa]|uniref:rhombosortase-dependent cadherin domain-containing protein n=1 Tax=Pseudoalteromonas umbrosa TaxID=3048489 RepID=UPI0024C43C80|nr:rhombosortase-dependent cadherin domain-containing protein [Pseudoalteromonas sp. B95]MDK1287845.1 rhombosortase-dependent cadherin domain-containing protein [Pseudoalteromonas sp. B95]